MVNLRRFHIANRKVINDILIRSISHIRWICILRQHINLSVVVRVHIAPLQKFVVRRFRHHLNECTCAWLLCLVTTERLKGVEVAHSFVVVNNFISSCARFFIYKVAAMLIPSIPYLFRFLLAEVGRGHARPGVEVIHTLIIHWWVVSPLKAHPWCLVRGPRGAAYVAAAFRSCGFFGKVFPESAYVLI